MFVRIQHCRQDLTHTQLTAFLMSLGVPNTVFQLSDGWVVQMKTREAAEDAAWVLQKYASRVRKVIGKDTVASHLPTFCTDRAVAQYDVQGVRAEA